MNVEDIQSMTSSLGLIMSDNFCLKWNDFQSNAARAFSNLRKEDDFYDVTLVSDDRIHVSAHKLVLSACSEYFKSILKQNKHSNPMLCLQGINSNEMNNVLNYIYNGEVEVSQDNLDRFLELAQRFKLEGLNMNESSNLVKKVEANLEENEVYVESKPNESQLTNFTGGSMTTIDGSSITDISEINEKIEELVDRQVNCYVCRPCGKIFQLSRRAHALEHVETHIEGLSVPCHFCERTFKNRGARRFHERQHKH